MLASAAEPASFADDSHFVGGLLRGRTGERARSAPRREPTLRSFSPTGRLTEQGIYRNVTHITLHWVATHVTNCQYGS